MELQNNIVHMCAFKCSLDQREKFWFKDINEYGLL